MCVVSCVHCIYKEYDSHLLLYIAIVKGMFVGINYNEAHQNRENYHF